MPELPEVETMKKGLTKAMLGFKINKVDFNAQKLRYELEAEKAKSLSGLKVLSITRRAKYLILELENNMYVVMHAGMSGSFKVLQNKELQKHDHIVFEMENGYFVIYNDPRRFGFCLIYNQNEFKNVGYLNKLGLEPFSQELNVLYLKEKFKNKKIAIKQALLNQEIVVGIGNIYASEILFNCKISPLTQACNINEKQLESIIVNTKKILTKAIELGGSTIKDHKNTDGKMGYFQNHLNVYGKEKCPNCNCDSGILKIVQNQRATYYCKMKQR